MVWELRPRFSLHGVHLVRVGGLSGPSPNVTLIALDRTDRYLHACRERALRRLQSQTSTSEPKGVKAPTSSVMSANWNLAPAAGGVSLNV